MGGKSEASKPMLDGPKIQRFNVLQDSGIKAISEEAGREGSLPAIPRASSMPVLPSPANNKAQLERAKTSLPILVSDVRQSSAVFDRSGVDNFKNSSSVQKKNCIIPNLPGNLGRHNTKPTLG